MQDSRGYFSESAYIISLLKPYLYQIPLNRRSKTKSRLDLYVAVTEEIKSDCKQMDRCSEHTY